MIVLDTHIWIWKVSNPDRLDALHRQQLRIEEPHSFGVSVISCWEVAKLVELGRLVLDRPVLQWIEEALASPAMDLLPLSTRIAVESTELPEPFHRDPADQMLVATARVLECPIMSEDSKIASYPHVRHA